MEIMLGSLKTNKLSMNFAILSIILLPRMAEMAVRYDIRDYCKISKKHNMCRWTNTSEYGPCSLIHPNLIMRMNIVKKINILRTDVANYRFPPQPPAADMRRVFYKDELQYIAERWAIHCDQVSDREFYRDRRMTGDKKTVGVVSVEAHHIEIDHMIDSAFREGRYFPPDTLANYKEPPLRGLRTIFSGSIDYSRYVQLVWSRTEFVGCAILDRGTSQANQYRLLCYMQQSATAKQFVYVAGKATTKCPKLYGADEKFKGLCSPNFLRPQGPFQSQGSYHGTAIPSKIARKDIIVAGCLTLFAMAALQLPNINV